MICAQFQWVTPGGAIIIRDAPITHWPIIGRPIIGAKQSADYRPITD